MPERPLASRVLQFTVYTVAVAGLALARVVPFRAARFLCGLLGDLFWCAVPRRRNLALANVGAAFAGRMSAGAIRRVARTSCQSVFLTAFEALQSSRLPSCAGAGNFEALIRKAAKIHEESRGCIFVTPHLGNWELLPRISALAGIPLVIVARPLGNPYLEKLLYRSRIASGHLVIPKKNAFFVLQRTLQRGTSLGLLTDQSTMKGLSVDFFGRKATTTPVPALLAVTKNRPVVVVACCRTGSLSYEGFVSDPIWPEAGRSEKEELFRITREMNAAMEAIIGRYPEQYLWMHDRWKAYEGHRALIEEDR